MTHSKSRWRSVALAYQPAKKSESSFRMIAAAGMEAGGDPVSMF
jgi:hypothetical protein